MSLVPVSRDLKWRNLLRSEGLVVHQEKVDITDVVDEESLVAGGHHVAGLLVGSKTNLIVSSALVLDIVSPEVHGRFVISPSEHEFEPVMTSCLFLTYRWHNHLALEPSSDTIVNTLRLSPAGVETFVCVALMTMETLRACISRRQSISFMFQVVAAQISVSRRNIRFFTIGTCFAAETI